MELNNYAFVGEVSQLCGGLFTRDAGAACQYFGYTNETSDIGTVGNILDEWKRAVQGSDYESVRLLVIHCKKEGINL